MSEREIKLHVEAERFGRLLDALGRRRLRRSALSAVYFDTGDGLLARHRFALRLRREDGRWVQALKGATGRTDERSEHEVAVDAPDEAVPPLDLDRHRRTGVGRRLRALLKKHGLPPLAESCRTEVTRRSRVLHAHGAVVEWALDEGEVTSGGRSQPISELELELKDGDAAGLYAVAHDWEALHGLWIDPVSKSERGALLRDDAAFRSPARAGPAPWSAKQARAMDGAALLRRMVAACLAQILPNAGEIARGSREPEHVHQLRVGLRRLRSAARAMKPFAAGLPAGWEGALRPVFDALGEARDRHVLATSLLPRLRAAGAAVADAGGPSEEAQARHLRHLVRGAALQGLLLRLLAFAEAPGDAADRARGKAGAGLERLVSRLRKLARRAMRDASRFETLSFECQHQVRKRLKRLRYLAEFAAPAFGRGDVRRWFDGVSPAQDALGAHVDLVLAGRHFESRAATDAGAAFAVEWLRAKSERSARAARKSLQRLRDVDAFW
jgi:triphosphatase